MENSSSYDIVSIIKYSLTKRRISQPPNDELRYISSLHEEPDSLALILGKRVKNLSEAHMEILWLI